MKVMSKSSLPSTLPVIMLFTLQLTLQLCCPFILLPSSDVAGNPNLFELGTRHAYQYATSVLLNEPAERKGKEIGYNVEGDVFVEVAWQNDRNRNEKLLVIELKEPKLLVQSNKGKTPSFDVHKSRLDTIKGYPILAHWENGKIFQVYSDERETLSLENFKKGIASLFQFQMIDTETEETDSSGKCQVSYRSIDSLSFSKTKKDCQKFFNGSPQSRNVADRLLQGSLTSTRTSTYKLSKNKSALESVTTFEYHEFITNIKKEAGSSATSTQHLILTGSVDEADKIESSDFENAVTKIAKSRKLTLRKRSLSLEEMPGNHDKEDFLNLQKLLKENREHLSNSNLGTMKSANAFVKLLSVARISTKEELTKALKGSKNKEILSQLSDLMGATHSDESHQTIMKIINLDSEKDFDVSERYLWALATGSHPSETIIRDILKLSRKQHSNEKLDETIILSLASMTYRLSIIPGNENIPLRKEVMDSIMGELELCENDYCKIKYLRALKNLKSPESIPTLIKYVLKEKSKISIEAIKAIRSFKPLHWTKNVIDLAQRVYFQIERKYDSSVRTLALDILLESKPRIEILEELLLSLVYNDPAFEVKQYLVQRIYQLAEKDEQLAKSVALIKHKFSNLFNNYHVGAQKGLTTAFARNFLNSHYRNGTFLTILEISKGLLKRGIVDIVVENSEGSTSLFTLGLFTRGLTSFVSSEDDVDTEESSESDEDVTIAGMELTVLGSQIRPFVFFNGQGELMGHVWSGTASEKTPAYQAIILVVDYSEEISLQNGFLVHVEALGAVSFDLSGQIQISLWNKNAHSLVTKDAGVSLQGSMKVDSSFVQSKVEFNVTSEMKLILQADINFYGGNSLCMQLSQPEVVVKHNVVKSEKIPGEKHRLRISKFTEVKIPGRTYALNKKNNEMCNAILN